MQEKTYEFKNEGHTLGNLIQGELLNDTDVVFAGYSVPHPLENNMILKIKTNDNKTPQDAFSDARDRLNTKLDNISENYKSKIY